MDSFLQMINNGIMMDTAKINYKKQLFSLYF